MINKLINLSELEEQKVTTWPPSFWFFPTANGKPREAKAAVLLAAATVNSIGDANGAPVNQQQFNHCL